MQEETHNPLYPPMENYNTYKTPNLKCKIQRNDFIEILNKCLSISIHVFIMSVFEIYFYFHYVVVIEKEKFLEQIIKYTSKINSQLESKPVYRKIYTMYLSTQSENALYENYVSSIAEQNRKMHDLLYLSCKMSGIIGVFVLFFFFLNAIYCRHLKWKTIIIENVVMFASLGVFEYMFFTNVVLCYNPITDAELQYIVYTQFIYNHTTNAASKMSIL